MWPIAGGFFPSQRVPRKHRQTTPKLQNLSYLTIHISAQSDKYSIIYLPLKIKFLRQHFQKFRKFLENQQIFQELKMCWKSRIWICAETIGKSDKTWEIHASNHSLFIWIRQLFDFRSTPENKLSWKTSEFPDEIRQKFLVWKTCWNWWQFDKPQNNF